MTVDNILTDAKKRMKQAVDLLHEEMKTVRTGQASVGMVENIRVEYYGTMTPVKQLANISAPEPQLIVLKPFDPSCSKEIEKAIMTADIGLNPQSDGKIVRVPVPPLTEETRKKISHGIKDLGEQTKVSLRNVRRDAIKSLEDEKKAGDITEDDLYLGKDKVQKMIDDFEKEVEDTVKAKTDQVMQVS